MSKNTKEIKNTNNNTDYYIGVETLDIKKPDLKKIYTPKKIKDILKLLEEIARYEEFYKDYSRTNPNPAYKCKD